jgi:predicted solute-binding protein
LAKKIIIFNLEEDANAGEFAGNSGSEHLKLVLDHIPDLKIDYAVADSSVAISDRTLAKLVEGCGGELILGDFALKNGQNHHDTKKLASTFTHIFS